MSNNPNNSISKSIESATNNKQSRKRKRDEFDIDNQEYVCKRYMPNETSLYYNYEDIYYNPRKYDNDYNWDFRLPDIFCANTYTFKEISELTIRNFPLWKYLISEWNICNDNQLAFITYIYAINGQDMPEYAYYVNNWIRLT